MAKVYVSPGAYTEEKELAYYNRGLADSSLGLVGETSKGPAFLPVKITNMGEYRDMFGQESSDYPMSYVAKEYFKYGGSAYVTRVLGQDVVNPASNFTYQAVCGSTGAIVAVIAQPSSVTAFTTPVVGQSLTSSSGITFTYAGAAIGTNSVQVSFSPSSPIYVENIFPRTNGTTLPAVISVFPKMAIGTAGGLTASTAVAPMYTSLTGYSNAHTPMIVSSDYSDLFTIYTIADGTAANSTYKIAIENVDQTGRTFDVLVREFGDLNYRQNVLERYTRCTMDPNSANYIARMIGDSRTNDGDYNQISNYVYVTVASGNHLNKIPCGFKGWYGLSAGTCRQIAPSYKTSYLTTDIESRTYMGLNYDITACSPDDFGIGAYSTYNTEYNSGNYLVGYHFDSGASSSIYSLGSCGITSYSKAQLKFVVPFIGGTDGWLRTNDLSRDLLTTSPTAMQLAAWSDAIDTLANTEAYDINLLAVPGVAISSTIGSYAVDMAETRADCLYIGDMKSGLTTPAAAINDITALDSNYAATYWPYVQIYDAVEESNVWIPPTAAALRAIAYTDTVAYPWFAPAGMNRGLVGGVNKAQYKLTLAERDELYEGKINPVATLQNQVVLWGQKTLQENTTSLDRINVRRLLLYVRKVIANVGKYMVFSQNDATTWNRFKAEVNPILETIKNKSGLYDFRVIMDETTNTDDIIDRNQMVGQIYLKPTKSAEVITINFNILATGAVFDE